MPANSQAEEERVKRSRAQEAFGSCLARSGAQERAGATVHHKQEG